jgi:hypothetical protein
MNAPTFPAAPAPVASPAKPWFRSRTALAGILTTIAGALGHQFPGFGLFLATHANEILILLGILSVILRRLTHGRMVLFPDDPDVR